MKHSILTFILISLLISFKSLACTCAKPISLKAIQDYEYENSEFVFIGEVIELNLNINYFKIRVIESFKGGDKEAIYSGTYDEQCGPIIGRKGKWLIYANLNSNNILEVNECGLTRSLKNPEYNTVISGLIEKKLTASEKGNRNIFNINARKILESELKILKLKAEILKINKYIEKVNNNKDLVESITEGSIKYGKNLKRRGGFEYYEFFAENPKELYRIEFHMNTDDYLIENYYYKNNQLVFAESVIKKENGESIKTKIYLKDSKIIYQVKSDYVDAEKLIENGKKYLTEFKNE